MTTAKSSKWLTPAEICEELGIARTTWDDWRATGKAPKCIKLPNGKLKIRRTDYECWLAGLEDDGTESEAA